MTVKLGLWDSAKHLKTSDDIAAYLDAAFEEGDLAFLQKALGNVARSQGMTEIAKKTGMSRSSLYKALGQEGNPSLETIFSVLSAMGLRLSVAKMRDRSRTVAAE
jgi:probable addiction module antidote protein